MAAPLIIFKMAHDMQNEQIKRDINLIKKTVNNEKVIKINLFVKNDLLQGIIINTDCNSYNFKVDSISIIPIAKHYGLYSNEFKQKLDNYYLDYLDCCILF